MKNKILLNKKGFIDNYSSLIHFIIWATVIVLGVGALILIFKLLSVA